MLALQIFFPGTSVHALRKTKGILVYLLVVDLAFVSTVWSSLRIKTPRLLAPSEWLDSACASISTRFIFPTKDPFSRLSLDTLLDTLEQGLVFILCPMIKLIKQQFNRTSHLSFNTIKLNISKSPLHLPVPSASSGGHRVGSRRQPNL